MRRLEWACFVIMLVNIEGGAGGEEAVKEEELQWNWV